MLSKWLLGLTVGFTALSASAQTIQSPMGRTLKVDGVQALLKIHPMKLVEYLNSQGVKVFLLPNADVPMAKKNPMLRGLPVLDPALMAKFDLTNSIEDSEAVFISKYDPCCDLGTDFILTSEAAAPLTIIHEATHFLFKQQMTKKEIEIYKTSEKNALRDRKALEFRFDKVYRNWNFLEEELWRRDMANVLLDYTESFTTAVNMSWSEEIFIERSLQALVPKDSMYYEASRIHLGENYVKATLKRIATKTADAAFVLDWVQGEIKLREEEMTLEERYRLKKQFATINARIKMLAYYLDKLSEFKLDVGAPAKK